MSTVKVEVTTPGVNKVIRNSDRNIHIEFRRIDELRRFVKINLRWRCHDARLRRRCRHTSSVARHLIPIGIHTLDISIVISALGFPARGLAGV